jgi:hypothetical protein
MLCPQLPEVHPPPSSAERGGYPLPQDNPQDNPQDRTPPIAPQERTPSTLISFTEELIKDVLKKFKRITRPESAVIVQARTGKIGLRDYVHKIGAAESPRCPCGARRQTMHHTLLKCPEFDELRKGM